MQSKLFKIRVLKKDIESGRQKDGSQCPIAKAFRRTRKRNCFVDAYAIEMGLRYFSMPPAARQFMKDFDRGKKVKPFSFQTKEIL